MSSRSEWRHAALLALTVSDASRGERRLAQHLLDCMDENDLLRAQGRDLEARLADAQDWGDHTSCLLSYTELLNRAGRLEEQADQFAEDLLVERHDHDRTRVRLRDASARNQWLGDAS